MKKGTFICDICSEEKLFAPPSTDVEIPRVTYGPDGAPMVVCSDCPVPGDELQ